MSHPNPPIASTRPSPALWMNVVPGFYVGITILLFFAVSALAFFTFAQNAVADELTPHAPGSIAGVVKTSAGEPHAGIEVTLYKRDPYHSDPWTRLRIITTQADGQYRFTLLPAGTYRIGANDPKQVYAPIYYPAAPTAAKATDITVIGNQLEGIDLTLQPVGQITGVVSLTGGMTVTYGYVSLYQEVEYNGNQSWQSIQHIFVSSNGVYSFTSLSAIPYRVCATVESTTLYAFECYDNVYDINAATSLTVTAGATISNVNLVLGDGADFAQVSGQVTSLTNEPLADIDVYALLVSLQDAVVIPVPPLFPMPYATHTDSAGHYHFPSLVEGRYRLYFKDVSGQYAVEYYNDTALTAAATILEVAPKEVISNVNIQLGPGSHIQGLITILDEPAPNASVTIEMKTPTAWRSVVEASFDSNSGRYDSGGLPPGVYRVRALTTIGDGYSPFYSYSGYFGGSTPETATEIALAVGVTKTADFTLSGGPRFEASIAGRITANGAPLAGAKVALYGGFSCCSSLWQPSFYLFTDAEGRYSVNGLDGSIYVIGASDPVGLYATTYYSNEAVPDLANFLMPSDEYPATDININLPLAGAISGRVTTADDKAVAGLFVSIYANPAFVPGYSFTRLVSNDSRTDAEGRYLVKGLHAGDYHICFSQTPDSSRECYGRPDVNDNSISGIQVPVVAGETTTNIDLLWGPNPTSYLPIIAQ